MLFTDGQEISPAPTVTSSICDYKLNARMCIRGEIAITGSVCECVYRSVISAESLFVTERLV